jgi:hypothetical protein
MTFDFGAIILSFLKHYLTEINIIYTSTNNSGDGLSPQVPDAHYINKNVHQQSIDSQHNQIINKKVQELGGYIFFGIIFKYEKFLQ